MSPRLPRGGSGRALAAALTILGASLLWLGLIAPALDWFHERQENLAQQAMRLQRMRSLAASLPELRQRAAASPAQSGRVEAALGGASDAVAAANLQKMLDALARQNNLRIASTETLAAETSGAWRTISVRITLSAQWQPLVQLLRAVAAAPTAMVVDNLQLRGPSRGDPGEAVNAAFSVTAWRRGGKEAP